ncbi:MAG: hypothetical protein JNM18_07615 [Planctomycetaceae bacterium]|nr:hypothetical protein [Planctomycetaceae bacterium]
MNDEADNDDDLVPAAGQIMKSNPFQPAPRELKLGLSGIYLLLAALLLFVHLGAYGLWSDEADTVLFAQGVATTGDTTARLGHNVYAYRQGALLRDLHNRQTPPLSYYVLAPFVSVWGNDTFAARAPFALAGLLMVILGLVWLWHSDANPALWLAYGAATLGQVSFFLYSRQGRYYALAMLATLAVTYVYLQHRGRVVSGLLLLLAGLMLLTSQYLNFAALVGVLAVDYALWQRQIFRWSLRDVVLVFAPLTLFGVGLWWFWSGGGGSGNGPIDLLILAYWNLRDLHACECVNLLLLVGSPLMWLVTRDRWLLRLPLAIGVYALITAILSPQPVASTRVADVRYLAPLILASIALTARWCYWLILYAHWKALPLIALAVWTNALFLLGSWFIAPPGNLQEWATEVGRSFRCTPFEFIREIAVPRATASRQVSDWITSHVADGKSVWVVPGEETYPHMAQAPHALYAWQLDLPANGQPAEQFRELPPIHFFGREPVDYMIVYGPFASDPKFVTFLDTLQNAGHGYRRTATLDVFWDDAIRPELFWRRFRDLRDFDRAVQAVYVYERIQP